MECVCAIAVVGIISAIILPLTAGAIRSMRVSDGLRTAAAGASAKNASVTTDKNDKNTSETMYVTIDYTGSVSGLKAESAFVFTKTTDSVVVTDDGKFKDEVVVTYYDLKYGKEGEDIKK